jgi:hypothetical protein
MLSAHSLSPAIALQYTIDANIGAIKTPVELNRWRIFFHENKRERLRRNKRKEAKKK